LSAALKQFQFEPHACELQEQPSFARPQGGGSTHRSRPIGYLTGGLVDERIDLTRKILALGVFADVEENGPRQAFVAANQERCGSVEGSVVPGVHALSGGPDLPTASIEGFGGFAFLVLRLDPVWFGELGLDCLLTEQPASLCRSARSSAASRNKAFSRRSRSSAE